MNELRRFERFVLNAPTRLYLEKNHEDSSTIQSTAHDISSGGAFISLKNSNLKKNTDIDVEIILTIASIKKLYGYPSEVKLKTSASITRKTFDGIGICFKGKSLMISNTN